MVRSHRLDRHQYISAPPLGDVNPVGPQPGTPCKCGHPLLAHERYGTKPCEHIDTRALPMKRCECDEFEPRLKIRGRRSS